MLEAGSMNLYDQACQEGYEIGVTESSLNILATMAKYARIFMSEAKWERFKKSEEKKCRQYRKENPDSKERYDKCYDEQGNLVKEEWIEEQKLIMTCMRFPEEGWDDLCRFAEKYPELPPGVLARRVIRESEYKYI
ncbi:MAG: hypothetical protein K2O40_15780 [Lachnospiraceae bacterium]|nr:hypothetical protein [Lachnospiraceae bacterium]